MKRSSLIVLALAAVLLTLPATAAELAQLEKAGTTLTWNVAGSVHSLHLVIAGPDGQRFERTFPGGNITLNVAKLAKGDLADGLYSWELRENLAPRTRGVDAPSKRMTLTQSGAFTIQGGAILADTPERLPTKDQVIADDLIVQSSICVGFDCVNGESFGFDTIRLKENNTRIKFEDTSTGSFPSNDWQLTANDSAGGGQNKFSVEDITGARVPLTIEAGSTTNSLYVDSTGRVGFRTSTPVLDLHVSTSNTPGLRLEQNNTGGFTAQTWDVAGNEANFFVRDVTGGSRLSFRIRPGAPTSSVDISADGDVGIGTASPQSSLHVNRADGTANLLVEESGSTTSARNMLSLVNNGPALILFEDTNSLGGTQWQQGNNSAGNFTIRQISGATADEVVIQPDGDVTILGTLTQNSDRTTKENIVSANPLDILQRVRELPISYWTRKGDDPSVRHLGPMSQDFYAVFGLGQNERSIATIDTSGVALAAVQGLHDLVQEKDAEIDELRERLARLEALLNAE